MIQLSLNDGQKSLIKGIIFTGTFIGLIFTPVSVWRAVITVFSMYVITGGWKFFRIVYYTFGRDFRSLIILLKTKIFLNTQKSRNTTVPKLFKEIVRKYPNKLALANDDTAWTFTDLDTFSNRIANCLLEQGFHSGEDVALFMESKPEFVGIWLGMAKAGLISALINTNQRLKTLIHSMTVVNCKAIIFGAELSQAVKEIIPLINSDCAMKFYCYGNCEMTEVPFRDLKSLLNESSSNDPPTINRGNFTDRLLYIYTSGTTGLPKAAIIKNSRFMFTGTAMRNFVNYNKNDKLYTSLPLYHLAGGILGISQCILYGNSVVIRSKFSASKFWDDCIKHECTVAQYIGEICRYLLAQPPKPTDRQHKIRVMYGNGLRPNIWKEFVNRFSIERIVEVYGSTEGNSNVANVDNREGSCGFLTQIIPSYLNFIYPVTLIKVDEKTGEPIRDKNGLCVRAKPFETGEFVGKIVEDDPIKSFDGYASTADSQKKIIRNVFSKGDKAFVSGDLLTMDEFGYLYFKDRTGDTFRWKGENVSTTEIEAVISGINKLADCVVYGVEIAGCEGRAGMAAILDPEKNLNISELFQKLKKVLPLYSIPVFIRIANHIEMTATFKLPKNKLQTEGYNSNIVKDELYYLDAKSGVYLPIDNAVYDNIQKGIIRF